MPEITVNKANEIIVKVMDGRKNSWLQEKLEQKGISLDSSQISQRLSGLINWTGNEVIACFEIFNIINEEILGTD